MTTSRRFLVLVVASMAMLAPTSAAADCQPAGPIEEVLQTAEIVFVGTVVAVEGPAARFAVTDVWAGDVGATVEVRGLADPGGRDGGFGAGFSEDDRHWTRGETYLVLPWVDGGVLRDSICTSTTEWRDELAALRPASAVMVEPATVEGELPVPLALLGALSAVAILITVSAFARRGASGNGGRSG